LFRCYGRDAGCLALTRGSRMTASEPLADTRLTLKSSF
jgi:hypothetical protein